MPNTHLNDAQLVSSGLESEVFLMRSPSSGLVLKKRRQGGRQQYPFEAFAYTEMKRRGAAVPDVLYADEDILLMTKLAGEEIDDKEDAFKDERLYNLIGKDLAAARSIQFAGYGTAHEQDNSFVGEFATWQEYLGSVQGELDALVPMGSLSQLDIEILQAYWHDQCRKIRVDAGSLVHGDFAMSAIFALDREYTGLIDFGDAFIGDPLMDIAYFRFKEVTKPYGASLYDLLANAYCEAASLKRDVEFEKNIRLYMVYWGARRLAHCPDTELKVKFADKLHVVAESLR